MFLYKVATVTIPDGIRLATSSESIYFPLDNGKKKLFTRTLKKNMVSNLL